VNKKILLFALVICSTVLAMNFASAADAFVFTDVSDARLLAIDNAGNTNATGWLAENGVKLSDTYCALTGCTYTGNVITASGVNITAGTDGFFIGDGSLLTGVLTQGTLDSYNTSMYNYVNDQDTAYNTSILGYVDAQDTSYNTSMAAYVIEVNATAGAYTDAQIALVGGMDYTNVAMINLSNTFAPQQTFTLGFDSDDDGNFATTKGVTWDGGGSVTAASGVITYKAGV